MKPRVSWRFNAHANEWLVDYGIGWKRMGQTYDPAIADGLIRAGYQEPRSAWTDEIIGRMKEQRELNRIWGMPNVKEPE